MGILQKIYNIYLESNQAICIDSRSNKIKNSIFFGIKGPNFNGNSYAQKALKKGASYAIVDEYSSSERTNIIQVNSTIDTLQELAKLHRLNWGKSHKSKFIIGITGTNGKTTTKEILKNMLCSKFNICATEGNFNNHIGVPLTVLSLKKEHDIGIIELGANYQGEIQTLCQIAEPTHGIITNIGKAHLKGFKNIENIKKTKNELYLHIKKKDGTLFVNNLDPVLLSLVNNYKKTVFYNCLQAKNNPNTESSNFYFTCNPFIKLFFKNHTIQTKIIGNYNAENIASCIKIAQYFEINLNKITRNLEKLELKNNRSQLIKTNNKNNIILDAYNANPTSVSLAINNFFHFIKNRDTNQSLVILGDMLELGKESNKYHQEIVNILETLEFNNCVLIGEHFQQTTSKKDYIKILSLKECQLLLKKKHLINKTILIKGSRKMQLEKLLEIL